MNCRTAMKHINYVDIGTNWLRIPQGKVDVYYQIFFQIGTNGMTGQCR